MKNAKNSLSIILIAALLAFTAGYALANSTGDNNEDIQDTEESSSDDDHSDHDHDHEDGEEHSYDSHSGMDHGQIEVADPENPPVIQISVNKDPKQGYNLMVEIANFAFAPQNASSDHVDGEGHAHIYVNGVKINRLYGSDYHLADVKEGDVVKVTLNSNDHQEYAVDGGTIRAEVTIQ